MRGKGSRFSVPEAADLRICRLVMELQTAAIGINFHDHQAAGSALSVSDPPVTARKIFSSARLKKKCVTAPERKNDELGGKTMAWSNLTKDQRRFLKRLKSYKARGVRIIIDGRELPEMQWDRIFMLADREDDGSAQFYMSDYVTGKNGDINEIRFDRFRFKGF